MNKLSVLTKFCCTIGMLPSVYKISLTYEEQLINLYKYLEEIVIPSINTNSEAVKELQKLYNELKNYFENLDIQEEINIKLEEMLSNGELEAIITDALNLTISLDTTIDLINNINLKENNIVKTNGYLENGDLGGATFKIVSEIPQTPYFEMTNGLYAMIIASKEMNNLQFGIIGDGQTDITQKLQEVINFIGNKGKILKMLDGVFMINATDILNEDLYLIDTGGITLPDNFKLLSNNNTIFKCIPNSQTKYNIIRLYNKSNVVIDGGHFKGDRLTHMGEGTGEFGFGISITGGNNITIKNVICSDMWGDGIITNRISPFTGDKLENNITNLKIINSECYNNRRQGLSLTSGINVIVENCIFRDTHGTSPEAGIDIETSGNNAYCENILINNCSFINNNGSGVAISAQHTLYDNIMVNNSNFKNNKGVADIYLSNKIKNIKISNNYIDTTSIENGKSLFTNASFGNIVFENNHILNGGISLTNNADAQFVDFLLQNNIFEFTQNHAVALYTDEETKNILIDNNIFNFNDFETPITIYSQNTIIKNNTFKNGKKPLSLYGSTTQILNNIFDNHYNWCIDVRNNQTAFICNNIATNINKENYSSFALLRPEAFAVIKNNIFTPIDDAVYKSIIGFTGTPIASAKIIDNIITKTGFNITTASPTENDFIQYSETGGWIYNTKPANPVKGMSVFNNATNKPIWYNGAKWINADGTDA